MNVQRTNLDIFHTNPEMQQRALDWAKDKTAEIKGRIEQINGDAYLPEEAKQIYRETADKEQSAVDRIVHTAHTNQQYNLSLQKAAEAEGRRDAAEARRIKHEAEHDLKAAQQKAREEARAQLKGNELEVKKQIDSDLNEFETLAKADPVKNRDHLIELAGRINFTGNNAVDAGYLDPDKFHSYVKEVNAAGFATANYKERPQFGFFGPPVAGKNKNVNDQIKARSAYAAQVTKAVSNLSSKRQADARAEVLQMPPAAQQEYRTWADKIDATNMSPAAKDLRKSQLFGRIQAKYPPPPKGLPAQLSGGKDLKTVGYVQGHSEKKMIAPPGVQ
jgi:hypothetical protein